MFSITTLLNELALYQYKPAFSVHSKCLSSESYSVDINVATNDFLSIDIIIFLYSFKTL